jgi:PAS domain S-box-containing protein
MGVPLAAAVPNGTAPFYGLTVEQLHSLGMVQAPASLQQQPAGITTDSSAAKRRRVIDGSAAAVPLTAADLSDAVEQQGKGRKKSGPQVDRRRERNRILARRTRLRKKFFFESLQKEVVDLQRENLQLKDLVKTNLESEDSKKILDECDAVEKLPPGVLEACAENGMSLDSQDFNLVRSIQSSQHSFIITDPSLEDNPIVFASDDFLKLTGYSRDQVLGRNCRFLQGTDTSKESVEQIRKGLAVGDDVSVTLVNYTADGTPFWNKLFIAALRDAQNNIVNFIGVTVKVATPEPGHPEHGKFFEEFPTKEAAESLIDAMDDSLSAAMAATDGL